MCDVVATTHCSNTLAQHSVDNELLSLVVRHTSSSSDCSLKSRIGAGGGGPTATMTTTNSQQDSLTSLAMFRSDRQQKKSRGGSLSQSPRVVTTTPLAASVSLVGSHQPSPASTEVTSTTSTAADPRLFHSTALSSWSTMISLPAVDGGGGDADSVVACGTSLIWSANNAPRSRRQS